MTDLGQANCTDRSPLAHTNARVGGPGWQDWVTTSTSECQGKVCAVTIRSTRESQVWDRFCGEFLGSFCGAQYPLVCTIVGFGNCWASHDHRTHQHSRGLGFRVGHVALNCSTHKRTQTLSMGMRWDTASTSTHKGWDWGWTMPGRALASTDTSEIRVWE